MTGENVALDPYIDGLTKGLLQGLLLAWPVLVVLGLLAVGALALGLYRRHLIARSGLKDIDRMNGPEFERYLAVLFGRLGFSVERTADRGDYGADLIATRQGKRIVIQAKRWKRKVGVRAVQEAVAAKGYYSCEQAMVVTNSSFTAQAEKLAGRNKVELWDRYRLARAMASIGGKSMTRGAPAVQEPAAVHMTFGHGGSPAVVEERDPRHCAVCGKRVSERVREYCLAHESRFGGQVLCYRHQRSEAR